MTERRAVRPHPREVLPALGPEARDLVLGDSVLRLEGLDTALAAALERRWGPFLAPPAAATPERTIRFRRAAVERWLGPAAPGEIYRLEAAGERDPKTVVSYHFAVAEDRDPGAWSVAVADQREEPLDRVAENATRFVVSRFAAESGGFAMHAAGVALDGRAWLFAGPSGSGKTTAVSLAAPAASLGDDFGMVLPHGDGAWGAPAVPFDNAGRIAQPPPPGLLPVAGICRLFKSEDVRLERPARLLAVASLMGVTAFPWAMPDLSDAILGAVSRCVDSGAFAHLHFRRDRGLWPALRGAADAGTGA